ncbi:MAG: DNA/RNA nuclease SfsA [Fidelibacterota bacterium]
MKINGPLKDAVFIERPNRFLTIVEMEGERVESHLPDPGRLKELLLPRAALKVRKAKETSGRKTHWTTVMVKNGIQWVSIDSTLPNRFVGELLREKALPMFKDWRLKGKEVPHGRHRFDFLLSKGSREFYLEVKSVTLVEDGVAMFPDAVTERGTRHVKALAEIVRSGKRAAVLFVCQRSDVKLFRPQWKRDPRFAQALLEVEAAGVEVHVISANITPREIKYKEVIPYDLTQP